jgi:hypothetical protein
MSDPFDMRGPPGLSLHIGLVGLFCCGILLLSSPGSELALLAAGALFLLGVGCSLAAVWGGVARLAAAGRSVALGAVMAGTAGLALGGVVAWRAVDFMQEAADRAH